MRLSRVCRKPAVSVSPHASVQGTLQLMITERVGAAVVVEDGKAVGIFTRRDAIERVVLAELPLSTEIRSVMTSPVEVLPEDADLADALRQLAKRPYNHLPIVDSDSKVVGLATTKPMMKQMIDKLSDELGSLESFITADGIGG